MLQGTIVVVRPKPEAGTDVYQVSAVPEYEGPYNDFSPERILDMLSRTENWTAQDWRDRCRERLSNEAGEAPSPRVAETCHHNSVMSLHFWSSS